MDKVVSKSVISGSLVAPTSKSALQRMIVAAFLSKGQSNIGYESTSEDAEAVIGVAESLGNSVTRTKHQLLIEGGKFKSATINIGESGLGLRMVAPVLSAMNVPFRIEGRGSLLKRPLGFVLDGLQSCGVQVSATGGSLPMSIMGPICTNSVTLDGSVGSQLLTGFLFAAPLLNRDYEIRVINLKSKPYIDLTISILNNFGIDIENSNYEGFLIRGGQVYKSCNCYAEGDWSGSAFVLVAAAIAGELNLTGIDVHSFQGDKKIKEVLKMCGATVIEGINEITVKKNELNAFEVDVTDEPDLFPPLVALAVNCAGQSVIKGVGRLKHKESDRAQTLQTEFNKLGANIRIVDDFMYIEGCKLKGTRVFSNHDHRIAMALAVAAITAENETIIENAESVGKSWPGFFEKFASIGAHVS
ncbi:MAG: 3-phosphoshikimate 1-carboxyvinyltransferase [Bacteroidales bacterium]